MFLNNLLIAYRNLLKNRLVSMINILGLSLGLASALLAVMFARHELTYEKCHVNADRIAQVFLYGNFGGMLKQPTTFGPEGEAIKNMFPEVESNTISYSFDAIVKVGDKLFQEDKIVLADSNVYSVFTFYFINGSPVNNTETAVLSESTARKYFGLSDPLGKRILISCFNEKIDFVVTGVFKDLPSNTHVQAEIILPFALADRFKSLKYKEYSGTGFNNYVLLKPGTDIKALNSKIAFSYKIPVMVENISAFLMPLKNIHFNGAFDNNRGKLLAFLIGGLFVLFTSCFNYINLTNILFANRSFENGIRAVNGGSRRDLFFLLIIDSGFSAFIGFAVAFLLIITILPWFNSIMDTQIVLSFEWATLLSILGLFVFTVLLSGLYPALKFSGNKTVNLIKYGGSFSHGRSWSRIILTSFQFILATLFIQVLLLMNQQNEHLSNANAIGYNADNVICMPGKPWGDLKKVKAELLKNPNIEHVSWCSSIPSMGINSTSNWINKDNKIMVCKQRYEYDLIKVYQIKMEKGRFFSPDFPSDIETSIIINNEAAQVLGYTDPIGKPVWLEGKTYTIIGLISYYMALPPIFNTLPMVIRQSKNESDNLVIRINPNNRQATHQFITSTLQRFNSEYPINIRYHDEVLFNQKEAKSFISAIQLMNLFFILTILMSVAGLFGLSVFIAQKFRKEIGIRKVCGATKTVLIARLLKGVFLQGLIAVAIATPISWVFSKGYLSVFPNHFEPGLLFFFIGGGISIIILLFTVSWQTLRAASRNPVESLRYE